MDMVIYLTEDKEDAEELRELGLATTTYGKNPGKWSEAYSATFSVLRVVIIANKDVPGRTNAIQAAIPLYGRVASLKLLELPDRDGSHIRDVIDWLEAGGTREELEQLCDKEEQWQPAAKDNMAHLIHIADLQSESVEWLWHPYLPKAKLTLLEGDPGVGKSWVSLAVAAAISVGRGLPEVGEGRAIGEGTARRAPTVPGVKYNAPTDGNAGGMGTASRAPIASVTGGTPVLPKPAAVLLASAEDGYGDTIRPRLKALDACVENIHAIGGPLSFDEEGLRIFGKFIEELHPALIVIDPLVAYFGTAADLNRAKDTRKILSKLAHICEKHSASILAVRHLAKGGAPRAIYRGLGSIDITAACRSVLLAGCDPENPQKRALAHIKSNLAPAGNATGYEIRDNGFYWTGESRLTAEQILSKGYGGENKTVVDEAMEFLKEELGEGAVEVKQVFSDAKAAGLEAEKTLRRAKDKLGITAKRESWPGESLRGRWVWEMKSEK